MVQGKQRGQLEAIASLFFVNKVNYFIALPTKPTEL